MTQPIQVEVLGQAEWWLPWLPVLGSLLVAVGAVVGVIVNNKTNRKAIDEANDRAKDDRADAAQRAKEDRKEERLRDYLTWRRDRVLDVATDVIEATMHITDAFNAAGFPTMTKGEEFVVPKIRVGNLRVPETESYERTIRHGAAKLKVIGERELTAQASRIIRALDQESLNQKSLNQAASRMVAIDSEAIFLAAKMFRGAAKLGQLIAEREVLADGIGNGLAEIVEARAYFEACAQWVLRESVNPSNADFPEKSPIVPSAM